MRTVTISLSRPLRLKTGDVTELEMKEPTMADEEDSMAMAVDMGRGQVPLTNEMCMYAMLCNVPYEAIRSMHSGDYEKLRVAYRDFVRPTIAPSMSLGTPNANSDVSGEPSSASDASPDGEGTN